jgi:hypothetical protein
VSETPNLFEFFRTKVFSAEGQSEQNASLFDFHLEMIRKMGTGLEEVTISIAHTAMNSLKGGRNA